MKLKKIIICSALLITSSVFAGDEPNLSSPESQQCTPSCQAAWEAWWSRMWFLYKAEPISYSSCFRGFHFTTYH